MHLLHSTLFSKMLKDGFKVLSRKKMAAISKLKIPKYQILIYYADKNYSIRFTMTPLPVFCIKSSQIVVSIILEI